jgi:hypothetical protein
VELHLRIGYCTVAGLSSVVHALLTDASPGAALAVQVLPAQVQRTEMPLTELRLLQVPLADVHFVAVLLTLFLHMEKYMVVGLRPVPAVSFVAIFSAKILSAEALASEEPLAEELLGMMVLAAVTLPARHQDKLSPTWLAHHAEE